MNLLRHVHNVPIEAAHQILAHADLVWQFGKHRFQWRLPDLMLAARHFQTSLAPEMHLPPHQYEKTLLQGLLDHLRQHPTHMICVLYRMESQHTGWVCWLPRVQEHRMQWILQDHGLQAHPAVPEEVLQ